MIQVGRVRTFDIESGREVTDKKGGGMMMLPPAPGLCQVCATKHPPEDPHNPESLYYQVAFNARHGRAVTWTDALAHCTPEVRAAWRPTIVAVMRQRGLEVPPDLLAAEDA